MGAVSDGALRAGGKVTGIIPHFLLNKEATEADRKALRKLHQTLKRITEDFESRWHFNTSIAAIMELFNALSAAAQDERRLSGLTHRSSS